MTGRRCERTFLLRPPTPIQATSFARLAGGTAPARLRRPSTTPGAAGKQTRALSAPCWCGNRPSGSRNDWSMEYRVDALRGPLLREDKPETRLRRKQRATRATPNREITHTKRQAKETTTDQQGCDEDCRESSSAQSPATCCGLFRDPHPELKGIASGRSAS